MLKLSPLDLEEVEQLQLFYEIAGSTVSNQMNYLNLYMRKITLLLSLTMTIISANSQNIKKIQIKDSNNESGCSVYSFCDLKFQTSYSEDSSLLFTGECTVDSLNNGVICVKLRDAISTLNDAEALLINYLDFLKTSFSITKSAGYGKGHQLRNNEKTRGVVDYWEDGEHNNWKVKAWTDKAYIVILYSYSLKNLPETRIDAYLNSLIFPGM